MKYFAIAADLSDNIEAPRSSEVRGKADLSETYEKLSAIITLAFKLSLKDRVLTEPFTCCLCNMLLYIKGELVKRFYKTSEVFVGAEKKPV